jgi:DNA polymerase III epsilon subunit-like protein
MRAIVIEASEEIVQSIDEFINKLPVVPLLIRVLEAFAYLFCSHKNSRVRNKYVSCFHKASFEILFCI